MIPSAILDAVYAAERDWRADEAEPATAELTLGDYGGVDTFNANVPDGLFFATFQTLCPRAAAVTAMATDNVSKYALPDTADAQVREVCSEWRETFVCRPVSLHEHQCRNAGWPFHVAVFAMGERRVAVPAAVRTARALAARLKHEPALNQPATRAGQPVQMRQRHRRCLQFAEAPAWLVQFTVTQISDVAVSHNGLVNEHMYTIGAERYGISLRYIPRASASVLEEGEIVALVPDWTPQQAVTQATWLLDVLATALGESPRAVAERLRRDYEVHEMSQFDS